MTTIRRTDEELILPVVTLRRHGLSCRAIARALDMSRNAVRRLIAAYAAHETEHKALGEDAA